MSPNERALLASIAQATNPDWHVPLRDWHQAVTCRLQGCKCSSTPPIRLRVPCAPAARISKHDPLEQRALLSC